MRTILKSLKKWYLLLMTLWIVTRNTKSAEINLEEHAGELCERVCVQNETKICYFKFFIEFYQAMGVACNNCSNGDADDCNHAECVVGDGAQKGLLTINRQLPGPAIHVCLGDKIIVDVNNLAPGTTTSIHWHGLYVRNTKFMDGVPFITQCPIPFATTFRYQIQPEQVGTYFYHGHSGLQRTNGIYGALIIRQPRADDPHKLIYDFDLPQHHLVLSDTLHDHYAEFLLPGAPRYHNKPDSVLLNGRGTYINNNTRMRETAPPSQIFYVKTGKKYRFRAISAVGFTCLMHLQITKHNLTVIATDGDNVQPIEFNSIILNAGERYDFVLNANQAPGDYWIHLRGLGICQSSSLTEAFILLRYETDSSETIPRPNYPSYNDYFSLSKTLNRPNQTCHSRKHNTCVSQLKSLKDSSKLRNSKPDVSFYIGFNNYKLKHSTVFNNERYIRFRNLLGDRLELSAMNEISFVSPSVPLLSQPNDIDESMFCDEENLPESCNKLQYCPCVHRLKVPLNSIVELVLVDERKEMQSVHHPIHLHGYHFLITDMGQYEEERITRAYVSKHKVNGSLFGTSFNERPPLKDTVSVPSFGYAIVRFEANNAGYWFLHCHYDFHMVMGMALVLQVGEKAEMPKAPKNFPKCGNFLNKIEL